VFCWFWHIKSSSRLADIFPKAESRFIFEESIHELVWHLHMSVFPEAGRHPRISLASLLPCHLILSSLLKWLLQSSIFRSTWIRIILFVFFRFVSQGYFYSLLVKFNFLAEVAVIITFWLHMVVVMIFLSLFRVVSFIVSSFADPKSLVVVFCSCALQLGSFLRLRLCPS
jgi:hypothetical protein